MENFENMEISLEKIELVKDRTGVSYKEAKEALEKCDANVVEAIIMIEDGINGQGVTRNKTDELVDQVKEVVRKGNVSKICIKKGDDVVLNLPVTIGILGTVIFPWAALVGAVAALGTKCSIEIIKEDGSAVNVSEKANSAIDTAVSKGGVILDEVKDKSGEFVNYAKNLGSDAAEFAKTKGAEAAQFAKTKSAEFAELAKEKSTEAVEFAKEKSEDAIEMAKSAGADAVQFAKEKTSELKRKAPESEAAGTDDFDLSDLDLSEMGEVDDFATEAEQRADEIAEAVEAVADAAVEFADAVKESVKPEE
ncbi:MAG: DUF4342 domain-containing protein [Firmicutes bacterium]|nr:DUF4342 domain-containing protein [Bacillota bacterium]